MLFCKVVKHGSCICTQSMASAKSDTDGMSTCTLIAVTCIRTVYQLLANRVSVIRTLSSVEGFTDILDIASDALTFPPADMTELMEMLHFEDELTHSLVECHENGIHGVRGYLYECFDSIEHDIAVTSMVLSRASQSMACIKFKLATENVYLVLDPHIRLTHPEGPALLVSHDLAEIVHYIDDSLQIKSPPDSNACHLGLRPIVIHAVQSRLQIQTLNEADFSISSHHDLTPLSSLVNQISADHSKPSGGVVLDDLEVSSSSGIQTEMPGGWNWEDELQAQLQKEGHHNSTSGWLSSTLESIRHKDPDTVAGVDPSSHSSVVLSWEHQLAIQLQEEELDGIHDLDLIRTPPSDNQTDNEVVLNGSHRHAQEHIRFLEEICGAPGCNANMVEAHLVDNSASFSAFSHIIDSRILRALADLEFARPTLVQAKAIPLALENRDILARARTGSGKTAAYCIPVVQKILSAKSNLGSGDDNYQTTRSLILVPTRELAEQVLIYLKKLLTYCDKDVIVSNAASMATASLQRVLLSDKPDIVISTPSKALALLQSKALSLTSLETLVIDEADLILSYGHDEDVRQIFTGGYLPKVHQSFLMSATMTEDVEMLKGLTLRNPAILKLEEGEDEASNLSQYSVRCSEVDKFLFTYVILKLKLIRGKCIIFVNDVDRSYRVKLFLEQFSIKSCVLNSELPLNSRYHVVQEFNKGVYDYIIATDESGISGEYDTEDEDAVEDEFTSTQRETTPVEDAPAGSAQSDGKKRKREASPSSKTRKRNRKSGKGKDMEYGVTRGVDFVDVACVLNFDLPTSSRSYTHRVGRTARAGRTGMSLSFVVPKDQWGKNKVVGCLPSAEHDEAVFKKIEKEQSARGSKIKDYKFDMTQVEGFRYRMEDALRSVTRSAIKEARIKELKTEILNSDKLKAHFEDNPLDLEFLRHDKPLHPTRIQSHMKHIPKYLLPKIAPVPGTEAVEAETNSVKGFVPFKKDSTRNRGRGRGRGGSNSSRGGRKKSDPLKKFGR
ncbi:hypothetical protein CVT24_006277 [Panaeolus cyanescens]|uniref:RNA helicase n=1 Tax=Panaeolus cyanescens TaxID=181874 RepID=A0A409VAL8_9AGAR|nr:hypothetical protein CVT24_006277 [Panaeolus cyanescens]